MTVKLMKSKLHRIRVTEAKLDYTGSLTIDEDLMDAAGIFNYEKLLVANVDNGERFETYAIRGPRGSKVCCLNGAAAHKGKAGDKLIVMTWATMDASEAKDFVPKVVVLDDGLYRRKQSAALARNKMSMPARRKSSGVCR